MEKPQETNNNRVQITKAVFDGLELIRNSGATNMFDRPMVLTLAREWNLTETADWIERVDPETYGHLIIHGPDVIEDGLTDQNSENDPASPADERDLTSRSLERGPRDQGIDVKQAHWRDVLIHLGMHASLTLADTYDTELMGVLVDPSLRARINGERIALMKHLAEASNLSQQLEETLSEIERGVASLQYLIDPENN